ncbi:hypothetical protein BGZ96_003368 [Linnemannia gamsii]|uniref:Uncharacterized protein n=1 Tax=Linnemannia gamsii TaxID=64522 RepID=A0ABQ7JJR0_9FUNG|nr:hypothetical protein BGZ96_003368 [Linnemannia gamsii]
MILLLKQISVLEGHAGVTLQETTFESYMDSLQHVEAARQAQSIRDKHIYQQAGMLNKNDGALNAPTLTTSRDEGADMDLDIDTQRSEGPEHMNADVARGKMKEFTSRCRR